MWQKEVSFLVSVLLQRCMHGQWYLGWEEVSCLEMCPHFRGVLIESGYTVYTKECVYRKVTLLCHQPTNYMFVNNLQTMWKEHSNLTGDKAGVHVVCVCTVNILHVRSVVVCWYRHIQSQIKLPRMCSDGYWNWL